MKYQPQLIIMDEGNVHLLYSKLKISDTKDTVAGLGIKERLMYSNPSIAWRGACVYMST